MVKITKFDPTEYLKDEEDIAAYLAAAFESGDTEAITAAVGTAAKAKGMSQIAEQSGIGREQLYRAFRKGSNPTLKTLFPVMQALGVSLTALPVPVGVKKVVRKKKAAPRRRLKAEVA